MSSYLIGTYSRRWKNEDTRIFTEENDFELVHKLFNSKISIFYSVTLCNLELRTLTLALHNVIYKIPHSKLCRQTKENTI